ncbi:MAG: DUF192 domain-containing protein [Thermodesulfobacteriota bacterium]
MATSTSFPMGLPAAFKFLAMTVIIVFLVLPAGSATGAFAAQTSDRTGSVRPDGHLDFVGSDGAPVATIVIEIAKTAKARSKGLMGRTSLRMSDGMLFIFEEAEVRYFWMFNTPVSLDMIFIDPERRIVHIAESTQPMSTQTYSSRFPARYVVEVPAGFVRFFKIKTGMRVQWRYR